MEVCFQYKTFEAVLPVSMISHVLDKGKFCEISVGQNIKIGTQFIRAGGDEDGTIFTYRNVVYVPICSWKVKQR